VTSERTHKGPTHPSCMRGVAGSCIPRTTTPPQKHEWPSRAAVHARSEKAVVQPHSPSG
jgi:hypothetical protein